MDITRVLNELEGASAFELYRLSVAINAALDEPARIVAAKAAIHIGMETQYFDAKAQRLFNCRIEALNRTSVSVNDLDNNCRYKLPYFMLNLGGIDVSIRNAREKAGMSRHELAIGDRVCFMSKYGKQVSGSVLRLNSKTVTLSCGDEQWRVAYQFLSPVIDGEASRVGDTLALR